MQLAYMRGSASMSVSRVPNQGFLLRYALSLRSYTTVWLSGHLAYVA